MKKTNRAFDRNVFINCPFDDSYSRLFQAIVFTIYILGFRPRCSKEINSGGDRLSKIVRLISSCKYSIHDISRIQRTRNLPRFNMPFELGIDIGCRAQGNRRLRSKNYLILETHEYRYRQFLSDLSGRDISAHHNHVDEVISVVRDWLNDAIRGTNRHPLPSGSLIHKEYRRFRRRLPEMCRRFKLRVEEVTLTDYAYTIAKFVRERSQLYK
jgi:hypothetical protein